MKLWFFAVPLLLSINRSLERCVSSVAVTECRSVAFSRGRPVNISSYRSFLQFKDGGIPEIPSGTFQSVPDVTTLYLSFNAIKRVEPGAFRGLTKLTSLVMNNNQLELIPNGVFEDCGSLTSLDLGANRIRVVEKKSLLPLVNLEEIILSFNQLETVPEGLAELRKLKNLNLSGNKITSIPLGLFTNMNELQILNLESNKIRDIPVDAFRGLSKLQEINLKDNYLSSLNAANLMSNLQSLKTIKLNINDFVCSTLRAVIAQFKTRGVQVAQGFSKAGVTVDGMQCKVQ